jgi:hypothetical protein
MNLKVRSELELSDDVDQSGEREVFEGQYFEVKAKCNKMVHPVVNQSRFRHSSGSGSSERRNTSPRLHGRSAHVKLPFISLPTYGGDSFPGHQHRVTY